MVIEEGLAILTALQQEIQLTAVQINKPLFDVNQRKV
jgi:hypothetical protein